MEVTKELIQRLRKNLGVEAGESDVTLAAFDRAVLNTILENSDTPQLTRGQKAARTRARNRKAREAEASDKVGGTD